MSYTLDILLVAYNAIGEYEPKPMSKLGGWAVDWPVCGERNVWHVIIPDRVMKGE